MIMMMFVGCVVAAAGGDDDALGQSISKRKLTKSKFYFRGNETVNPIISKCSKLPVPKYKSRLYIGNCVSNFDFDHRNSK